MDYNVKNSEIWKWHGAHYTIRYGDLIRNGFDMMWNLFPIWDESYRQPLVDMIERYFWTWEIGFETEFLFRQSILADMTAIMPKYNVMFKARNLTVDPLVDHDNWRTLEETGTKDTTDTRHEDKNSTTDSTVRQSDTPQQNLSNLGYGSDAGFVDQWLTFGEIDNGQYKHGIDNKNVEDTDTSHHLVEHIAGRNASQQKLAQELYETAYDIELLIINDLKHNFLQLFND